MKRNPVPTFSFRASARKRPRHNTATTLPGLTEQEHKILQLRSEGCSYPAIQRHLGIAPRKCWDVEKSALRKVLHLIETNHFLGLT